MDNDRRAEIVACNEITAGDVVEGEANVVAPGVCRQPVD
jgi:hypothetical protein